MTKLELPRSTLYKKWLMRSVAFKQVDVFTSEAFKGNPVAVVMDAKGLSTKEMQEIANWTNLSETTFVLSPICPKADYRVRIFSPTDELQFAGHPTIGTAYALLEDNKILAREGKVIQECGAGLIDLHVNNIKTGKLISFELPEPGIEFLDSNHVDEIERILNCPIDRELTPALIDVGIRWIVAHTFDSNAVLAASPNFKELAAHDAKLKISGICLYGESSEKQIEVRSFTPAWGMNEDPVCGSGNGSVAAFIRHYNEKQTSGETKILSSQGRVLGREGRINLTYSTEKILVGGTAVTCIDGVIKV